MFRVHPDVYVDNTLPAAQVLGGAAAAGTSPKGARVDHQHALAALTSGDIPRLTRAHLPVGLGCRVQSSAPISLTSGSVVTLTFDTEQHDSDAMHDTGANTSRITFPLTGLYGYFGIVVFAAAPAGVRTILVRKNGVATNLTANQVAPASAADSTICHLYDERVFTAGDYIELLAFQDSGGPINALAATNYAPCFGAYMLSPST